MMVNRYITALLVVLAATGMEAQTYQQALKFALTDISYDEFIQQPEAKALEEDILYVLKAIKQASEDESNTEYHYHQPAIIIAANTDILTDSHSHIYFIPLLHISIWHHTGASLFEGQTADYLLSDSKTSKKCCQKGQ